MSDSSKDSIDVKITQINNIHAKLECDSAIAREISEFFTFDVPGAAFSPEFRNHHWDGKIRLFSLKTYQIYVGLIPYVESFCKENNYTFTTQKDQEHGVVTKDFVKSLNLPIKPRDYQLLALQYAIHHKRTVIISPTASGKSLIIYMMIRWMLSNNKKRGLLIVPTVSLVEQMYGDFKSYGWDVENHCQKIYQGHSKEPCFPLVISTWQSIFDMPKKYFSQFDFIIGDEAHTFKAKSLTDIMKSLINCDYRIGTTGTLDGTKVHKLVLEGLFGHTKRVVSTKELIDRKQLADFKIKCMVIKYPEAECNAVKSLQYQEEIDFIIRHEKRNRIIRDLAINLKGNTLILYTYVVKHGKVLFELFKEKEYNRKVFFVCGETDVLDREEIRHITEKENDAIIVASYGTFSTGINIRNLHNIIFASPTKSRIRSLQSIGRGLRLGDNKDEAVLYDIVDDLRCKTHINFTLKHFEERIKMYNDEKFPFKIYNIGLE